ncbi:substrate-binding domain-containing protein [Actinocatenispora rupis]|uniref:VWA domain-containing protein n=1 Tax=Actinocatenispora rupis TaxID=519421 RepID=A0A8J3JBP9_9ACTN|nr:substrate-binding domain-containing protein [Actinocatenispora rupis]GID15497.1 VWA domain-containing protein [Actinocatenispora rupis]
MPRGNHAIGGLRSHRRRFGSRLIVAPWIIITVAAVLVLAGLTVTYVHLVTRGCSGTTVTATVLADQSVQSIVDKQAAAYNADQQSVDGHCARIDVQQKDSASVAAALAPSWNPRTDGPRPDAWVPESSLWVRMAASRQDAAAMLPERQPSLARSPAVIAMPAPMAKALGPVASWHDLATRYAGKRWVMFGHADWDAFKVAVTDPTVSTAGLHAMTAMADANNDGDITDSERRTLNQLWQYKAEVESGPDRILQRLSVADADGPAAVLRTVSAFPALERDVVSYNEEGPRVGLTAVYPKDGSSDADFPYLVVNWSGAPVDGAAQRVRSDVARAFLARLRGTAARAAFQDAGYRDANRKPGPAVTAANGVARTVPTMPRAVMTPASISQTASVWAAISRESNVLVVMDVSAAMGKQVPGTGRTGLQLAASATGAAVNLMTPQPDTRVGLWDYAENVNGNGDNQEELVPLGKINDTYQGSTRAVAVNDALDHLSAVGKPTLFDAALAAYRTVRAHYRPSAINQVVIITGDGGDSASKTRGAELTAQLADLADRKHPVPIVTVGYGAHVDLDSLQAISQATGGRTYQATSPTQISSVLLTALFSRAPAAA